VVMAGRTAQFLGVVVNAGRCGPSDGDGWEDGAVPKHGGDSWEAGSQWH
jgi:hypothetical protein